MLNRNVSRWIRVHYEHDSIARSSLDPHGPVLQPALRGLLILVCDRYTRQYASSVCRFPTRQDQRTYGCPRWVDSPHSPPRAYHVINRRFRSFANRFLCLSRQVPRFLEAIPDSVHRLRRDHWYFGHAWDRWLDVHRLYCPLDWEILLALGYGICQKVMLRFLRMPFPAANLVYPKVYPYHRLSV